MSSSEGCAVRSQSLYAHISIVELSTAEGFGYSHNLAAAYLDFGEPDTMPSPSSPPSSGPVAAPAASPPTKSSKPSNNKACRYGTSCGKKNCGFRHPNTTTFGPETPSSSDVHADSSVTAASAAATRQDAEPPPTKAVGPPPAGKNAKKNKKRKEKTTPAAISTVQDTRDEVSETIDKKNTKDTVTPVSDGGKKKDPSSTEMLAGDVTEQTSAKPAKGKKGKSSSSSKQPGTTKKSERKKPCRFGNECRTESCRFLHPDREVVDTKTAASPPHDTQEHQQQQQNVHVRLDTTLANRANDDQQVRVRKTHPQPAVVPPKRTTTASTKPKKPCRFGAECRRPNCLFLHNIVQTQTQTTTDQSGDRQQQGVHTRFATVTPDSDVSIHQAGTLSQGMNEAGMWAHELEDRGPIMHASDLEDRMLEEAREAEVKQKKRLAQAEKRRRQAQEKKERQEVAAELKRSKEKEAELERQRMAKEKEEEQKRLLKLLEVEKRKHLELVKAEKENKRLQEAKERKRLEQEKVVQEKRRLREEKERTRLEHEKAKQEKKRLQEEKERKLLEQEKTEKENKRLQEEEKRKRLEEEAIAEARDEEELQERLKEEKRRRVETAAREQKAAKERRRKEEAERKVTEKENFESTVSTAFDERTAFWERERETERETIEMLIFFCAAEFCRKQQFGTTFDHHTLLSDAGAKAKLEESCEEAYLELYKDAIITRIIVTGVSQPTDINDRLGTIERWSESKGKYYVGLDPKKNSNKKTHFMNFSPGNLRAAPIQMPGKGKKAKAGKPTDNTCLVFASSLHLGHALMCEVSKSTVERMLASKPSSLDALLSQMMAECNEQERLAKLKAADDYRLRQEEERRRVAEERRREEKELLRRAEQRRHEEELRDRKRQQWEAAHEEYRRYQQAAQAAHERARGQEHDPRCGCPRCEIRRVFFDQFFFSYAEDSDSDYEDDDGWDRRYNRMDEQDLVRQDQEAADLLGVDIDSTQAEIKRQYKRNALKYHPDKYRGAENHDDGMTKEESEEHFKKLSSAYDHLMLKFEE
jgi:hypothetical protein